MELLSHPLESLSQIWRERKTERFLQEHRLNVEVKNLPDYSCLIPATHPTIWDSVFWRKIPETYHAVQSWALKKTGIPRIDARLALDVSHMIPVYVGDREKRQETYRHMARLLDGGHKVVINPTGRTTGNNEIPQEGDIRVGGIIRVLQLAEQKIIVPAVVKVEGEVRKDYTVEDGSSIQIIFAEKPLDLNGIDLESERVNDELLKSRIVESWHELSKEY